MRACRSGSRNVMTCASGSSRPGANPCLRGSCPGQSKGIDRDPGSPYAPATSSCTNASTFAPNFSGSSDRMALSMSVSVASGALPHSSSIAS